MREENKILDEIIENAHPLIEQMNQIVFFKYIDFRYAAANKKLVDFSKLGNINKILGENDYNLPWAEGADFYRSIDKQILLGEEKNIAMQVRVASGELVTALQNKKALKDPNTGKIVGIMVTMEEVKDKMINEFLIKDDKNLPPRSKNFRYCIDHYKKYELTTRESECLFYLLRGLQTKMIAEILGNSPRTIEKNIASLKDKFGCRYKSDLISKAHDEGIDRFIPPMIDLSRSYG